jgi:PAS domain S-box-containing protein
MKIIMQRNNLASFGLALALLFVVGLVSCKEVEALIETGKHGAQAYETQERLRDLQADLMRAEATQLGYLVTEDESYLNECFKAISGSEKDFAYLKQLTSDDPTQQQQLDRLESLVARRLELLRESIGLAQAKGFAAARRRFRWDEERRVMAGAVELFDELADAETDHLNGHSAMSAASARNVFLALLAGAIASVSLLLLVFYFLSKEIAMRRESMSNLQESEARYTDLFENAHDLIHCVRMDGSLLYVNRAWREVLERTPEEVAALSLFDIIHPDEQAHCMELFAGIERGETPDQVETKFITKSGRAINIQGSVSIIFKDGKPYATRGIFRDVTARDKAEATLKESEQRYRQIIENANDLIYRTDAMGNFTFVNSVAARLMKAPEEELIGKNSLNLVRPDYRQATKDFYNQQFRSRTFNSYYEYPALTKDGGEVWLGQNLQIILEDGRVTGFQAVARDITERKRIEEALRESELKLRLVTQSANDAIVAVNSSGEVISWNKGARHIFGYTEEEMLGQSLTILMPEAFRAAHQRGLERHVETGEAHVIGKTVELTGLRKGGEEFL